MAGHGSTRHGCSGTRFPGGTVKPWAGSHLSHCTCFPSAWHPLPTSHVASHHSGSTWLKGHIPQGASLPLSICATLFCSLFLYYSHTFPPSMCQCLQVKSVGPMECQLNEEGPLSWRT